MFDKGKLFTDAKYAEKFIRFIIKWCNRMKQLIFIMSKIQIWPSREFIFVFAHFETELTLIWLLAFWIHNKINISNYSEFKIEVDVHLNYYIENKSFAH